MDYPIKTVMLLSWLVRPNSVELSLKKTKDSKLDETMKMRLIRPETLVTSKEHLLGMSGLNAMISPHLILGLNQIDFA